MWIPPRLTRFLSLKEKGKGTRDEYRRVKTDDYLLADGLHEAIVYQTVVGRTGFQKKRRDHLEVSIIFKIGAVGILVSVLSQILKHSGREEQAFLVSFSGLLLVLFWIVPYIYELFKNIQQLFVL